MENTTVIITHTERTSKKKRFKCGKCSPFRKLTKKQKLILGCVSVAVLPLVVLPTVLTHRKNGTPVNSQWLNVTGYPPIPIGIFTVIRPDAATEYSACVQPPSLWDCSLLKEQQSLITPNAPNQPNFRMKIKFRNTTALSAAGVNRRSHEHGTAGFFASKLIRSWPYRTREFLTDSLYVASPLPPSQDDQIFLGNTTDNNTAPFDGENTPFTMSFEEPVISHALRLKKRIFRRLQNLTNPFPDLTAIIPLPNGNGTAAAANLLPFPSNQPLRLYNRGLLSEHYGFYIYFDRSIFLKSILPKTALSSSGEVPEDGSGGAEKNTATVRCTWAQTRFVVHIWTNKMSGASLLYQSVGLADTNTKSTNDSRPPGSFPYPISIELDRHGGDITKKLIYCYNLDPSQRILSEQKKVQLENRTVGGEGLINPALGPFGHVNISRADGGPGGIDGGTGGCRCQWRNFNA